MLLHPPSPTWCLVKAGHSWRTTPYYYKNHLWGDPSLVMQRHDIQTYQFCTFLRPDRQINHSVNDRPWMRQNGPKSCGIIHAKTDSRKGIVTIYIYTCYICNGTWYIHCLYFLVPENSEEIIQFDSSPPVRFNSKAPSYFQVSKLSPHPTQSLGGPNYLADVHPRHLPTSSEDASLLSVPARYLRFGGGFLRMMGRPPTDLGGNLLTNIGRS